jgi:hypothetical protein
MTGINSELYLQVEITHLYMRRHNLTPEQFLELDKEYNILHFLDIGYEPYHLTGSEGILAEIEEIIAEQRAAKAGN